LRYASRQDRAGQELRDYQTVDLSQDFMLDQNAWTTQGWLDERKGGPSSKGTHIRLRDYRADSVHTVALTLIPADETPTIDDLEQALQFPERPLFIGRKTCLPATQLLIKRMEYESLTDALRKAPLSSQADQRDRFPAWWPVEEMEISPKRIWNNPLPTGGTGKIKSMWVSDGLHKAKLKFNMRKNSNE
jgi:CRISPR system Cascade subunit CasD